jgi:hypothetical protein
MSASGINASWPDRAGAGGRPGPGAVGLGGQSYRFAGERFDDDADQVAGSWRGVRVARHRTWMRRVPIH